jgi:hypothetical protein
MHPVCLVEFPSESFLCVCGDTLFTAWSYSCDLFAHCIGHLQSFQIEVFLMQTDVHKSVPTFFQLLLDCSFSCLVVWYLT